MQMNRQFQSRSVHPSANGDFDLSSKLTRVVALNGTDEGFYIVALHSLMESYANARSAHIAALETFWQKVDHLFMALGTPGAAAGKPLPLAKRLTTEHNLTNDVRHDFRRASKSEALAATQNFLEFCRTVGWEDPRLEELQDSLKLWDTKRAPIEQHRELVKLRLTLNRERDEHKEIEEEIRSSRDTREALEEIRAQLRRKDRELDELKTTAANRKQKSTDLRQKLRESEEERRQLATHSEQLKRAQLYMEYMERFTNYTRSRADYERSVMALSPEQKEATDRIGKSGDYLIHGPAGTGKTLVLIHAMDEELGRRDQELGLQDLRGVALVTFTRTLVRFDEYLANILGRHRSKPVMSTIDSFILERLREIEGRYRMDYNFLDDIAEQNPVPFLSADELKNELEDVIFGRGLTRHDYVDASAPRTGMKQPLNTEQRTTVWEVAARARRIMEGERRPSKNLGRLLVLERARRDADYRENMSVSRLFVDEVQDLSPVDVEALNMFARDGVILAGDEGQAIYQAGSSFKRLGVDVVGRSTVLSTNFRNTRPIHILSELYRLLWTGKEPQDVGKLDTAFREGATPEIWTYEDEAAAEEMLLKRLEFFTSVLGYEPENVAVLTLHKELLSQVQKVLNRHGYSTKNIKDKQFAFESSEGIRVSTVHSAKGVEFPVVLLYIPRLPNISGVSERAADERNFNLIYVAMTRALDNVQLFMPQAPPDRALRTLMEAHGKLLELEEQEGREALE